VTAAPHSQVFGHSDVEERDDGVPPQDGTHRARQGAVPLDQAREIATRIATNIERVIEGKPDIVRLALVVMLAEGHLLIEDVPGVGKTKLAKALARSID